jgi:Zn-dependent membrane protease YugP
MMFNTYWLWFAIPGILLGLYAQIKLSSTYNRYVRQPIANGLSGAEAAREILDRAGLTDMPVQEVGGHLTDHYDPMKKALFLSSENFHGRSLAAVGVAAHEAGHALQDKAAYAPLKIRMAIVPITNFASMAWMGLTLLGFVLGAAKFITIGIVLLSIIAFFQLITLPVEFDASRRAKVQLLNLGIVQPHEASGVSRVLSAAAMTYVAALVTAFMHLLYFIMLARNRD